MDALMNLRPEDLWRSGSTTSNKIVEYKLNWAGSYSTCWKQTLLEGICTTLELPARKDFVIITQGYYK